MAKVAHRIGDKTAKATTVSDEGIYQLYKNRSWRWGNHGAAFLRCRSGSLLPDPPKVERAMARASGSCRAAANCVSGQPGMAHGAPRPP
ncbi:DUF995 domain-containing protein [Mesorhizobium atlanticum]